ncbi:MAG: hypothetical protein ABSF54_08575 [Bryobacteraceae bacterium]|jgi:hypothetical protein
MGIPLIRGRLVAHGDHGVAHAMSQQAQEIGICMALGADAPAVIRRMVGQTLKWIGAGSFSARAARSPLGGC